MWRGAADEVAEAGLETLEGATKAQKGIAGEAAARKAMMRAGYVEMPARLPCNTGFDGVFVKYKPDGTIDDIIITESKFSSTGRASLTETKTMGTQLSTEWVDANIKKMLDAADPAVEATGLFLQQNRQFVRTKFDVLGPDGVNRWMPH